MSKLPRLSAGWLRAPNVRSGSGASPAGPASQGDYFDGSVRSRLKDPRTPNRPIHERRDTRQPGEAIEGSGSWVRAQCRLGAPRRSGTRAPVPPWIWHSSWNCLRVRPTSATANLIDPPGALRIGHFITPVREPARTSWPMCRSRSPGRWPLWPEHPERSRH
jgi:hypothetical protein